MDQKAKISALLARVGDLPGIPDIAQKVLALIRNPNSNMADLARVLSLDQSLAGLVLRWANSAYYGLRTPASTVQQAVVQLGQQAIRNVILASSVATILERPVKGYALEKGDLWRHSIGMASAARLVAKKFGNEISEEAYTAGLLADIGKLAFEVLLRDVDTTTPEWETQTFSDMEAKYFGVDHAALGAELARRWNLPPSLQDAIGFHHRPADARQGALLAAAVHIGDSAMMMLGIGIGIDGLKYTLDPAACSLMRWTEDDMGLIIEKVIPFIEDSDRLIHFKDHPPIPIKE